MLQPGSGTKKFTLGTPCGVTTAPETELPFASKMEYPVTLREEPRYSLSPLPASMLPVVDPPIANRSPNMNGEETSSSPEMGVMLKAGVQDERDFPATTEKEGGVAGISGKCVARASQAKCATSVPAPLPPVT